MRQAGVHITSSESAAFQLQRKIAVYFYSHHVNIRINDVVFPRRRVDTYFQSLLEHHQRGETNDEEKFGGAVWASKCAVEFYSRRD